MSKVQVKLLFTARIVAAHTNSEQNVICLGKGGNKVVCVLLQIFRLGQLMGSQQFPAGLFSLLLKARRTQQEKSLLVAVVVVCGLGFVALKLPLFFFCELASMDIEAEQS